MASIVVCGAGVIGLSAAAMLADDGHTVTVLESDVEVRTSAQAWTSWRRPGVAQFRQPHNLFARFRRVADAELPGLTEELAAASCAWVDPVAARPPSITDFEPRDSDEALRFVTGRRPVVEAVVAAHAQAKPGVTVRRGVRVHSLVTGRSITAGVPHVTGVRTEDGERIPAALVVDASGRRSPAERWLAGLNATPPAVEAGDRGFVYYTRYFTGAQRPVRKAAGLTAIGSFSILTLDGDNDTWSVTLFGLSNDAELKAARDPAAFDRVLGACPRHAHWLDGTALSEVIAMAGILDRYRRFVVDGRPVATGFVAIGDAWACTNPSAGRGLSTGLVHAQVLRRVVREYADDPLALALAMDEDTEQHVTPFVRTQAAADRDRVTEMAAAREGRRVRRMMSDLDRLQIAAAYRAEAFRGMLDITNCTAFVPEVLARPEVKQAIADLDDAPPPPKLGPDRAELLALLAG
jgi:2-polyprenyl-6-methoxyphenol hydroxylase-like FAD-dependent oxidoreductase